VISLPHCHLHGRLHINIFHGGDVNGIDKFIERLLYAIGLEVTLMINLG
jgi:hypothetical protein